MPIDELPDLDTAKQVARLLQAENERLHRRLEQLVAEIARLQGKDAQVMLQRELTKIQEQLALMQQRLYGASSEKRKVSAPQPPLQRTQRQQGPGPQAQPELPVQEVVLPPERPTRCVACAGVPCTSGRGRRRTAKKSPWWSASSCCGSCTTRSTAALKAVRR